MFNYKSTVLLFLITCLILLVGCNTFAEDSDWKWPIVLKNRIIQGDEAIKGISIGDYYNSIYTDYVYNISNLISKGWSDRDFNEDQYNKTLKNIWENPHKLRILEDDLIRLTAITWRLRLKTKCFNAEVDEHHVRGYFLKMLQSEENILKSYATSGFGALGADEDVETLISILKTNEYSYLGSDALDSLFMINSQKARDELSAVLHRLKNIELIEEIKLELSRRRILTLSCSD